MALDCDDVNARLLDLVYGEGDAGERQALQAHVDGCARCRADLEALGRTRATVRARLDDAPPPGARARIMEAAAQAIAGGARPATAAAAGAPVAAAARGAATTTPRRGGSTSFWAWLRGHWTLPTFATVGAVALMLLGSKVILNPKRAYERGHEDLFAPATAPAARAVVAEPAPAMAPPAPTAATLPARDDQARLKEIAAARPASAHALAAPRFYKDEAKGGLDDLVQAASGSAEPETQSRHRLAAGGKRKAPANVALDNPLEGLVEGKPPAAKPAPRAIAADDDRAPRGTAGDGYGVIGGIAGGGPGATGRTRAAPPVAKAEAPAYDKADREKTRQFAEAPTRLEKKTTKRAVADNAYAAGVGSASARAAAAPLEAESDAMEEAPAKGTRNYAQKPAGAPAPTPPPPSMDELARRADRLFADGRWDEAATAYQELLRRYPTADGAARWRARATEARRARVAAEAAKAPAPPAQPPAAAAPAAAPKNTSTTLSAPAKR